MCSLYSINNTKFGGQSPFHVVLWSKGSDSSLRSPQSCSSSASIPVGAIAASCSPSRRKKIKSASAIKPLSDTTLSAHQNQSKAQDPSSSSSSSSSSSRLHSLPRPHQPCPWRKQGYSPSHPRQNRRSASHWQQFHQHDPQLLYTVDAPIEHPSVSACFQLEQEDPSRGSRPSPRSSGVTTATPTTTTTTTAAAARARSQEEEEGENHVGTIEDRNRPSIHRSFSSASSSYSSYSSVCRESAWKQMMPAPILDQASIGSRSFLDSPASAVAVGSAASAASAVSACLSTQSPNVSPNDHLSHHSHSQSHSHSHPHDLHHLHHHHHHHNHHRYQDNNKDTPSSVPSCTSIPIEAPSPPPHSSSCISPTTPSSTCSVLSTIQKSSVESERSDAALPDCIGQTVSSTALLRDHSHPSLSTTTSTSVPCDSVPQQQLQHSSQQHGSCISGAAAVVEEPSSPPSSALHMFASERIQRPLPLTSKAFKRKPLDVSDNHASNNNNIHDHHFNNNNNYGGIQHHIVETGHPDGDGPAISIKRRSRRTRTLERLQAENSTLRASLVQAQSDVATEQQRREILDQLYLGIRKELGQKLEAEEIRAFNLNMQVEQQQQELRQLKRKLKDAHRRLQMHTSVSSSMSHSSLYRTGHGNGSNGSNSSMGSFSLSNGFSNIGGLMLHNTSSSNVMIGGQDDSDEFLINHAYSPSARSAFDIHQNHHHHSFANKASGGLNTVLEASDDDDGNEEDEEDDVDSDEDMEDAEMYSDEEEDEEDEDYGMSDSDDNADTLIASRPVSSAPTIGRSMSMQLSAVMEEEEEEEKEEEEEEEEEEKCVKEDKEEEATSSGNDSEAPCTMMEILVQRDRLQSANDPLDLPAADADETFASMVQQSLHLAVCSRWTASQARLQLDELVSKYAATRHEILTALVYQFSNWWEMERVGLGGEAATGAFGAQQVVLKETGQVVSAKDAVERRVETFFAPLMLQYVSTHGEQRMMLDLLAERALGEPTWLRNHPLQLVSLYKYDVVEADAILEWWKLLKAPEGVFGHGQHIRSMSSKFVAWLEDDDDDDSEEEASDDSESEYESSEEEDGDDDHDDDDDDDDDEEDTTVVAGSGSDSSSSWAGKKMDTDSSQDGSESSSPVVGTGGERRISFCIEKNLYYDQDGQVSQLDSLPGDDDDEKQSLSL